MKPPIAFLLAFLLSLFSAGCAATDLKTLEPLEPRQAEPGVTINRAGHPITLPLRSLADATFVGSDGELIFYSDEKSLYATVVTPEDWGNLDIQMNQAPAYIFQRDFSVVEDPELRKELEGIARMNLDANDGRELSVMAVGDITAYIAFSPEKSVIMLTSPDKPEQFSQLVLDRFRWEEIENEVLKGIGVK